MRLGMLCEAVVCSCSTRLLVPGVIRSQQKLTIGCQILGVSSVFVPTLSAILSSQNGVICNSHSMHTHSLWKFSLFSNVVNLVKISEQTWAINYDYHANTRWDLWVGIISIHHDHFPQGGQGDRFSVGSVAFHWVGEELIRLRSFKL